MTCPRVLIVLDTEREWSRAVLRGFAAAAYERDWALTQHHPASDLSWLASDSAPDVVVVGPDMPRAVGKLAPAVVVSVTVDRTADGVASVCLDERRIAKLALEHLLATGVRQVTTLRCEASPFALARERAFCAQARAAGVAVAPAWGGDGCGPASHPENSPRLTAWLRGLPRPCGVFAGTDAWARSVARYAQEAGLRVPEDLALIGVGNDELECGLSSPPLSSVMVPWQEVGRKAASLVARALGKQSFAGRCVTVPPFAVAARRSSDALAIPDLLVARAVVWLRNHATQPLTAAMLARAVGIGPKQLEQRFRRALNRSVQEELEGAQQAAGHRVKRLARRLTLVPPVQPDEAAPSLGAGSG